MILIRQIVKEKVHEFSISSVFSESDFAALRLSLDFTNYLNVLSTYLLYLVTFIVTQ